MQTPNQPNKQKQGGLFLSLLVLTSLLILAEISFSIQYSGFYFGDFKLIANHLSLPWHVILPGIFYFLFAQLFVHLSLAVSVWVITLLAANALQCSWKTTERLGIGLWFIALIAIFFANSVLYPNSKFSTMFLSSVHFTWKIVLLKIAMMILFVACLFAAFSLLFWMLCRPRRIFLTLTLGFMTLVYFYSHQAPPLVDAATGDRPNIIIIGIDSVRPDFLSFFGSANQTKHLDQFLNHATVFSEAMTPIARTYPAWVSILTGVYPKINRMRTDLADQQNLDVSSTLPMLLKQQGYKTIFATDETHFSNIDQRYGFDRVITPPIGLNDFLLGSTNDLPISNLWLNTAVGKYLFPYSYANRADFVTYDPNSFINLLKPVLSEPRTKPLLLIAHLCLPHFPYGWAQLPIKTVKLRHYQEAIKRADLQFHDFMVLLQKNKILAHSIVIILSDHGEGVEMPGDRITDAELFIPGKNNQAKIIPHFYPPSAAHEKVNMSGGHGTDVLGLSQYHTLFAVKTFGIKPNQVKIIPGVVSLMDIKPTVLDYLNLPLGHESGRSLKQYVFGSKQSAQIQQDFFVESDFSPEAVRSVHPEERKVLFEGIDYFRIDPQTARVVVRDSMLKMIISSKQYADYYGTWALALYPQNNKVMMPILVNLQTGMWTNDLNTDFALHSPANHMLHALKNYFGHDISRIENV